MEKLNQRNNKSSRYLDQLPDNYEMLLVSFFITNPITLAKLEAQWSKRDAGHKKYLGRRKQHTDALSSKDFGGTVSLIDPINLKQGFIIEIPCHVATGMYYRKSDRVLYVGSNKWIRLIKGGRIIRALGNNLFNDIHTLNPTFVGNLLVTSTGVDGILEINIHNSQETIWDWLATEHGYNLNPSQKIRVIDRSLNYQEIGTSTPEHTTHVNSSLCWTDKKILALLFHQGELVEIDIATKKTRVLLAGMRSPHHLRRRQGGWIISDSRNNRVLFLDESFQVEQILTNNYDWVQDCVQLNNKSYIIGDSNNNRLIRVCEEGIEEEVFQLKKGQRKMSSFLTIIKAEVEHIFYE